MRFEQLSIHGDRDHRKRRKSVNVPSQVQEENTGKEKEEGGRTERRRRGENMVLSPSHYTTNVHLH